MKHSDLIKRIAEADHGRGREFSASEISRFLKVLQGQCGCVQFLGALISYILRGTRKSKS